MQRECKDKVAAITELTSQVQIAELAAAKEQREKIELEKLLRKSISRMKQHDQDAVLLPAPAPRALSRSHQLAATAPIRHSSAVDDDRTGLRADNRSRTPGRTEITSKSAENALAQRVQRSINSFAERKRSEDVDKLSRSSSRHVHQPRHRDDDEKDLLENSSRRFPSPMAGKKLGLRDLL